MYGLDGLPFKNFGHITCPGLSGIPGGGHCLTEDWQELAHSKSYTQNNEVTVVNRTTPDLDVADFGKKYFHTRYNPSAIVFQSLFLHSCCQAVVSWEDRLHAPG